MEDFDFDDMSDDMDDLFDDCDFEEECPSDDGTEGTLQDKDTHGYQDKHGHPTGQDDAHKKLGSDHHGLKEEVDLVALEESVYFPGLAEACQGDDHDIDACDPDGADLIKAIKSRMSNDSDNGDRDPSGSRAQKAADAELAKVDDCEDFKHDDIPKGSGEESKK